MKASTKQLTLYTDGGARGNPGPAAVGFSLRLGIDELHSGRRYIGEATNNVAEYTALLDALKAITPFLPKTATQLLCRLDSELVVKQIIGAYKIKNHQLQVLKSQIDKQLLILRQSTSLKQIKFEHVPRAQNTRADQLVNQALDAQA